MRYSPVSKEHSPWTKRKRGKTEQCDGQHGSGSSELEMRKLLGEVFLKWGPEGLVRSNQVPGRETWRREMEGGMPCAARGCVGLAALLHKK